MHLSDNHEVAKALAGHTIYEYFTVRVERNIVARKITEDCIKVYAGSGHSSLLEEELMTILPEVPTPPSGHKMISKPKTTSSQHSRRLAGHK